MIVDDDQRVLNHLAELVQVWGFDIHLLQDSRQFFTVLTQFNPDLILLDIQMPHYDGRQLCRIVRQYPKWKNIPIIFLSHSDRPDLIYQIYESGADDYLVKPIDEQKLRSRLLSHLKHKNAWDRRINTDQLTQLMNRRYATRELVRYLRLAQRDQCSFSLFLIRICNFQAISEQYGGRVKESVLTHLSHILKQQFSREDIISRWGEDTFLTSVYGVDQESDIKKTSQLISVVKQAPIIIAEQQFLIMNIDVGLALYPKHGSSIENLLNHASDTSQKINIQDGNDLETG